MFKEEKVSDKRFMKIQKLFALVLVAFQEGVEEGKQFSQRERLV